MRSSFTSGSGLTGSSARFFNSSRDVEVPWPPGRVAAEERVQGCGELVDLAGLVRIVPADHLGWRVGRRQCRRAPPPCCSQPEVGQPHVAVAVDQDVRRLDVTVHHPLRVYHGQRIRDPDRDERIRSTLCRFSARSHWVSEPQEHSFMTRYGRPSAGPRRRAR